MNMIPELSTNGRRQTNINYYLTLLAKASVLILAALIITGCASKSGGYYKDDGPHSSIPANIAAIPNATPKIEQHKPANFRPYSVFGVKYTPIAENQKYKQKGIASWYGKKFHGQKTANGETYDMYSMTAAHPTLPLPSYAKVSRPANGRSVIVRINDRGPFHTDRIIDLSYAAAAKLGIIGPGSDTVVVEAITNDDIRAGNYDSPTPQKTQLATDDSPQSLSKPIKQLAQNDQNSKNNNIYLQFGAFASSANAQSLAERINRTMGASPEVTKQADLYKVRLGPYQNRNDATQAADEMQSYDLQPTIAIDVDI